jgi:hypothetical protein
MDTEEPIWDEEKQKHRYLKVSKFLFLITIIFCLWIAITIMGVYFLQLGNKWAAFTIEQWILSGIFLVSVVIGLEIVFLLYFALSKKRHLQPEPEKEVFVQGKKVHNFTLPIDAKGGIFSKTYILIDENSVLNLRYQMIPPHDLWGQHQ